MRQLHLKDLSDTDPGEGKIGIKFDYPGILELVAKTPTNAQSGMDIQEVRRSIKILDKIDAAGGVGSTLLLEEEEYNFLKSKLDNFRWTLADKRVVEFCDDVSNAQEFTPTPPPDTEGVGTGK